MLVEQAAESYVQWRGVLPPAAPVMAHCVPNCWPRSRRCRDHGGIANLIRMIAAACIGMALLFIAVQGWFALLVWWYADHAPRETWRSWPIAWANCMTKARRDVALPVGPVRKISRNLKRALIAAEDSNLWSMRASVGRHPACAGKTAARAITVAGSSTITSSWPKSVPCRRRKVICAGAGSDHHADAGKHARQGAHPGALPQRDRMGQRCVRRRGRRDAYYGVSAAQLSAEQAALAAMAPNPRSYERNLNAPACAKRPASSSHGCRKSRLPD